MPNKPYDVKLEHNLLVEMRDRILLAADIYRPDTKGRFPALVSMSPYGKERQAYPGGYYQQVETGDIKYFVANGYAHVIADSRGSMPSQGKWHFTDRAEQLDGYDLIEWVATQPWCDGNVAMVGESYYAVIQYLVAATQPPHLKTIVPFDGWTDFYRDVVYHGGLFNSGFMGYLTSVIYDRIQEEVLSAKASRQLKGWSPPGNVLLDAISQNTDGPYYRERSARTMFDKIKVPIYHMPCAHHYVHYRGQLLAYRDINTPKRLFVGAGMPWPVFFSAEVSKQIVRWLDYWLKGTDTQIMSEPPVILCVSGTNEWRYEMEYPLARTQFTPFYLHGGTSQSTGSLSGQLNTRPPAEEEPNVYHYPEAIRLVERNLPVLAFATVPLKENLELVGPASLTLYAGLSQDDVAWIVKIDDVAPDGSFQVISQGWLKASHRIVDRNLSRPGQPFHPHTDPSPVTPGDINEYEIEIWPVFRVFKKGHRLRVRLANSDARNWDVRPHHASFERPCAVTVYHDKDHPSHLALPVIPPGKQPTSVRPPVTLQPRGGTIWPKGGF